MPDATLDLNRIATDVWKGLIYTTSGLEPDEIKSSFPVLMFMDEKQASDLVARNPHVLYEYLDKAARLSVNGRPIFFSFASLSLEQWTAVMEKVKALRALESSALEDSPAPVEGHRESGTDSSTTDARACSNKKETE